MRRQPLPGLFDLPIFLLCGHGGDLALERLPGLILLPPGGGCRHLSDQPAAVTLDIFQIPLLQDLHLAAIDAVRRHIAAIAGLDRGAHGVIIGKDSLHLLITVAHHGPLFPAELSIRPGVELIPAREFPAVCLDACGNRIKRRWLQGP